MTFCSEGYYLIYSPYFDRKICQNNNTAIIEEKILPYDKYNEVKEKVTVINGICQKLNFYTPDGKTCFQCDDEFVGIPGCKGGCSFSPKRNQSLKCEGECKEGYIESSKGNCSLCYEINKGCHECHYENEYPLNYSGIKRQRRFVCDYCEEGYAKSSEGECFDCNNLKIEKCSACYIDPNNKDNYICAKCLDNYFINENGKCEKCDPEHFKGINKNKCFSCSDTLNGGIENCLFCSSDGSRVICNQCVFGYLLLMNNNSCLSLVNDELQDFQDCNQLTMINNKFVCTKCYFIYPLIRTKNNETKCAYLPTVYDNYFDEIYEYYFSLSHDDNYTSQEFQYYRDNDIFYQKYKNYGYCQEAKNIGTEDNPLYTCTKCYEEYYENHPLVKITEENSNVSHCISPYLNKNLKKCASATYKIKDGKEIYSCI